MSELCYLLSLVAYFEPGAYIENLDITGDVILYANGATIVTFTQDEENNIPYTVMEHYFTCNTMIDDLTVSASADATSSAVSFIEAGSAIRSEDYDNNLTLKKRKKKKRATAEKQAVVGGGSDYCTYALRDVCSADAFDSCCYGERVSSSD